jgi:hypothetical protein
MSTMKKKPTRMAKKPGANAFGSSASELLHVSEFVTARNGLARHRTKLGLEVSPAPPRTGNWRKR